MSKGFPISFRCGKCRSTLNPDTTTGRARDCTLTGRERPHYSGGRYRNVIATGTDREYTCKCGHTGWSSHKDLLNYAKKP